MTIIGLTGLAGSGKSTAAEYLVREHGFIRQGFAWPLKKMLRTLDPIMGLNPQAFSEATRVITLEQVFNSSVILDETHLKASRHGAEYRRLLQVLGTDCIRAVDPDFWVKAAMKDLDPEKDYVFDDVRFPNEARAIQAEAGTLIGILRPGLVRGDHPSEQHAGRLNEDWFIDNRDSETYLGTTLDAVMRQDAA